MVINQKIYITPQDTTRIIKTYPGWNIIDPVVFWLSKIFEA